MTLSQDEENRSERQPRSLFAADELPLEGLPSVHVPSIRQLVREGERQPDGRPEEARAVLQMDVDVGLRRVAAVAAEAEHLAPST
jgi:hypothetical protein